MANQTDNIPEPGRVRSEWTARESIYLAGDLVCVWNGAYERYLWFIAQKTHIPSDLNRPDENGLETEYWALSYWRNVTEPYTQPDYKYQRVHSISPQMIDDFIIGKGVPPKYYYDLLGYYNTRTNLIHPLELLTTVRGTIVGLKAWLNLINLNVDVTRLAPEEEYEFSVGGIYVRGTYEEWLKWLNSNSELNSVMQSIRYWNDDIDYREGDYIYYNKYDPNSTESTYHTQQSPDGKGCYCGCEVYKAKRDIQIEEYGVTEPQGKNDPNWEYVTGYYLKPFANAWVSGETPDNSLYKITIEQLSGQNTLDISGKQGIAIEADQQKYSCHTKLLMDFLVPAWIRYETGLLLADMRRHKLGSASYSVSEIFGDTVGVEPYTLTIYPYVGFDPNDAHFVERGELSHTDEWITEVKAIWTDGSEFEIEELEYAPELSDIQFRDSVLLGDYWSTPAYMWRENYIRPHEHNDTWDRAVIKIRMKAGCKVKLRTWSIYDKGAPVKDWQEQYDAGTGTYKRGEVVKYDGKYCKAEYAIHGGEASPDLELSVWRLISYGEGPRREFWRWQLLNHYHNAPRFSYYGPGEGEAQEEAGNG